MFVAGAQPQNHAQNSGATLKERDEQEEAMPMTVNFVPYTSGRSGHFLSRNHIRAAAHAPVRHRSINRKYRSVTVVIPCREGAYPYTTLHSLAHQTFRDFDVIVVPDRGRGANWARNHGFRVVNSDFVLFSDDDIEWHPLALKTLRSTLDAHPWASYSYGSYLIPGVGVRGDVAFDPARLQRVNYISTMSLIRRRDFPLFDESIRRFQDWDVWLTMLSRGKVGVHCGIEIFRTRVRRGITYGNSLDPLTATRIIKRKHGLA